MFWKASDVQSLLALGRMELCCVKVDFPAYSIGCVNSVPRVDAIAHSG
jgi:hypothetical protein